MVAQEMKPGRGDQSRQLLQQFHRREQEMASPIRPRRFEREGKLLRIEEAQAPGGHIPGAVNAPFTGNLGSDGRLLPAAALRSRFAGMLGDTAPDKAVFYCGSGVTAAHQLLALAVAGVEGARLYPGSWSEWIADPRRPVAGPPR